MTHDCCSNVKPQTDTSHPPAGGTDERGNKTVYSCPMHPEVRSERPELCPECGMALLPVKGEKLSARRSLSAGGKVKSSHEEHAGHFDKHKGHNVNIFKRKFWMSLVLTIPIVLYSEVAQKMGIALPPFTGVEWLAPILGSIVFLRRMGLSHRRIPGASRAASRYDDPYRARDFCRLRV